MRKQNWDSLLAQYLKDSESLSFEWGINDCALWAARFVDLMTGSDHVKDWLNLYNTESGAQALMSERGFATVADIANAALVERNNIAFAKRGDIVFNSQGCLGICNGRRSYFLTVSGLTTFPTTGCLRAWEV